MDGTSSKYDEITSIMRRLHAEDPARAKYKLYVTGHRLWVALTKLFGYYVLMSLNLPLPVNVVCVASPRVGNIEFARSFVELKSHGRLQHLRITNHRDPATFKSTTSALAMLAKATRPFCYMLLLYVGNGKGREEMMYFHTGIELK